MGGLFGGGTTTPNADTAPSYTGLRVQTSAQGLVIPIVYGTTRIPGNLIWYGNFHAIANTTTQEAGGKGGGGGEISTTNYTYTAGVVLALCEGIVDGILRIWRGKEFFTRAEDKFWATLGTLHTGVAGQLTDASLAAITPTEALPYARTAYVANIGLDLGSSDGLPALGYEVQGNYCFDFADRDANPKNVITDFLANATYGAGFPAAYLAALTTFHDYCQAAGLFISLAISEQTSATQILDGIITACNCAPRISQGILDIIPYGDTYLSANGATYTPPSAPLYDLDDDSFLYTEGEPPVKLIRKRPADVYNSVKIEYLNRDNSYNPDIAPAQDLSNVLTYGARPKDPIQCHFFCRQDSAMLSAQLRLQRENIRNTYQFKLGWLYIGLDPMDIVTITDSGLGLFQKWVRITEIEEDEEGVLSITAEECLNGTGNAPVYGKETPAGYTPNYNISAGNINDPVFMEAPDLLANNPAGPELWIAVSGGTNWGGCNVWFSQDDQTYKKVGTIYGSARKGALTAQLASGTSPDITHTLSILLDASGQLLSGTQADAQNLNTLCWVDGELIAYQTATLTGTLAYDLTYLIRGAYDTTIGAHAISSSFVRLDAAIFRQMFDPSLIGSMVYFKFTSFNQYGSGVQTLDTAQAHSYTVQGTALKTPLPSVSEIMSYLGGGETTLSWIPISDFRSFVYELRYGDVYATSAIIGTTNATQYPATVGDGTYWISAKSDYAYSATPASITISNSVVTDNVVQTWDEPGTSWTGTKTNCIIDAVNRLILATDGNGFVETPGYYETPVGHIVDIGTAQLCRLSINYSAVGDSINSLVDNFPDFDAIADLDGNYAGHFDVKFEISISQDASIWSGWQQFVTGQYYGRAFKMRITLISYNHYITPAITEFAWTVDMPDRIDTGTNITCPSGGLAVTFLTPFQIVPNVQITILNAQSGDRVTFPVTPTTTGFTTQIINSGSGVQRQINWLGKGF